MAASFVAALLAFSPVRPGVSTSARPPSTPLRAVPCMRQCRVPLTGQTLQAALKLRCDITGASYAIFWAQVGGELLKMGAHSIDPKTERFVAASASLGSDASCWGTILEVKESRQPALIVDIPNSDLQRKELAFQCGVSQVALLPLEGGVLEIGNTRSRPQWTEVPQAPLIPKAQLRKAFEDLGALYAMYWQLQEGDVLRVIGAYENPSSTLIRDALRSDGNSFVKVSKQITVDAHSEGPVAEALRSGQEIVVGFDDDQEMCDLAWPICGSMSRASVAKEFGLSSVTMVPVFDEVHGERGVRACACACACPCACACAVPVFDETPRERGVRTPTRARGHVPVQVHAPTVIRGHVHFVCMRMACVLRVHAHARHTPATNVTHIRPPVHPYPQSCVFLTHTWVGNHAFSPGA